MPAAEKKGMGSAVMLEVGDLIALLGLIFYRMVVFGLARSEIIHL